MEIDPIYTYIKEPCDLPRCETSIRVILYANIYFKLYRHKGPSELGVIRKRK